MQDTLIPMDSVRFGRALGMGAREAAKALAKAVDAAAAPTPARRQPAPILNPAISTRRAGVKTARQVQSVRRGGKRFGEAVWGPFARLSGVLFLEIMGVLFGMFAFVAGVEVWRGRTALKAGSPGQSHELFALAMLAVFGYFALSSFFKAGRRGKQ